MVVKIPRLFLITLSLSLIILLGCKASEPLITSLLPTDKPSPNLTPSAGRELAPTQEILPTPVPSSTPLPSATPIPSATPLEVIRFAVIGDYGLGTQPEADVAKLVKSWRPDFIITVGDNNYPVGSAETIDERIGKYYHEYIYPYRGAYGAGADRLRFFPTLGNHDYDTPGAQPYLDYFELPGNERYYHFTWGPVFFLALNSDSREPDGVSPISIQAQWAQSRLAEAESPWKIVYFHAPPYSSGYHGSIKWMRWDFAEWGASAVLSGHNHAYERLMVDGLLYIVNASGGGPIYNFKEISEGSQFRYNQDHGAILVTADALTMKFEFYNTQEQLIDQYILTK